MGQPARPLPPECIKRGNRHFTPAERVEAQAEILIRMSQGEPLTRIVNSNPDKLPSYALVLKWSRDDAEFAERYEQARKDQAELWLDMTIEETMRPPWAITWDEELKEKIAKREIAPLIAQTLVKSAIHADMQHRKMKLDTFKWYASKMHPKRYGTQQDKEDEDGKDSAMSLEIVTFER